MHFAYIDESGDNGFKGSSTFSLACILIDASEWPIGLRRRNRLSEIS
jgi:hypothetical protein